MSVASISSAADTREEVQPDPLLQTLNVLAGHWDNETSFKDNPHNAAMGKASFEWMDGRFFLIENFENVFTDGDIHKGMCIFKYDEDEDSIRGYFFDSLGFTRRYRISIIDNVYLIIGDRERFKGDINKDIITGTWEQSEDGRHWSYLCDVKMTRVKE